MQILRVRNSEQCEPRVHDVLAVRGTCQPALHDFSRRFSYFSGNAFSDDAVILEAGTLPDAYCRRTAVVTAVIEGVVFSHVARVLQGGPG